MFPVVGDDDLIAAAYQLHSLLTHATARLFMTPPGYADPLCGGALLNASSLPLFMRGVGYADGYRCHPTQTLPRVTP